MQERISRVMITIPLVVVVAFILTFSPTYIIRNAAATTPTITWDGGGDGFSWSDKLNWSADRLPTGTDYILIKDVENPYHLIYLDVSFHLDSGGKLEISGSATTLSIVDSLTSDGTVIINAGSRLPCVGDVGDFVNNKDGIVYNYGIISNNSECDDINYGTINNYGTIDPEATDTFVNHGTTNNYGTITSLFHLGVLDVKNDGVFNNYGTITVDGVFDNYGTVNNQDKGTISISHGGFFFIEGVFSSEGFNNYGTANNEGAISITSGGFFNNYHTVNNDKTIKMTSEDCSRGIGLFNNLQGTVNGNKPVQECSPVQIINYLINYVNNSCFSTSTDCLKNKNALLSPLQDAKSLLSDSNTKNDKGACDDMNDFISAVKGLQKAGKIDPGSAIYMLVVADNIIHFNSLTC